MPPWRRWVRMPHVITDMDALVTGLASALRPGDHALVMSNGGFGGLHTRLLAALQGRSQTHELAAADARAQALAAASA